MATKKKLIIVEGPRGTGKTTLTNWLREQIPSTNLFRLSGCDDKTSWGKVKSDRMYEALIRYMKSMECQGMNLIFDRIWITEEVFCNMDMKQYSFHDTFNLMNYKMAYMDYDIFIISLTAPIDVISDRLRRDKVDYQGDNFNIDNIKKELEMYSNIMTSISRKYPWINVSIIDTSVDTWRQSIQELLGMPQVNQR